MISDRSTKSRNILAIVSTFCVAIKLVLTLKLNLALKLNSELGL